MGRAIPGKGLGLLDIALDHLSLGRAYLGQAVTASGGSVDKPSTASPGTQELFSQAATHLDQAVDGLRRAGQQEFLPLGLLARAALRRATGAHDRARADLDEALSIATRGGMRLHEADCHLEYARLCLATGETEAAREHLARAKTMVAETGYHRRDGEVAALERETGGQGSGDRNQVAVGFGEGTGATGSVMVNVVPRPGVLATSICPPWAVTNWRVIARPNPAPPPRRLRLLSPR